MIEHGWGQRGNYPLPPVRTDPETGRKLCRWCEQPIPKNSRRLYWCGTICIEEYKLRGDWNHLRAHIIARDREKGCAICKGQRFHPELPPANRLQGKTPSGYELARNKLAIMKATWTPQSGLRGPVPPIPEYWGPYNPVARAWEVDHIIPVANGGTDHPANLRLLCRACHLDVTRAWWRSLREKADPQLGLL